MTDDTDDKERNDAIGAMIQRIAEAVDGASIHDGLTAMAYVFADVVLEVDTDIHSDLYAFGEMVLAAMDAMGEDDGEGADEEGSVLQ